jgi:hypothetical protein
MKESVSHSFADESIDAKAKWFRTLSIEERMAVFVAFTNLILENNPSIVNRKGVRPALKDVRIFAATPGSLDNED